MSSFFYGVLVDLPFILYVRWVIKSLRAWEFDEMEGKSTTTEKRNSYRLTNLISNIVIWIIIFSFDSCGQNSRPIEIPEVFQDFITNTSEPVEYNEIIPAYGTEKEKIPLVITRKEALEDIRIMEYLFSTSYSGFDYWKYKGIDFSSYFADLRNFVSREDTIHVETFEYELAKILKDITDGHIAIDGLHYNMAYKHKSIYYCDVLVEKTNQGLYKVIDTKLSMVNIGDLFTQENRENFLFKTLSPQGKSHYLLGIFSFDPVYSHFLSFNHKTITVPFHKTRLLYAEYNNQQPLSLERENDIPVIQVSSFTNNNYAYMREFMRMGTTLKNERRIIVDLFYNMGGSSVFPRDFIKNLNNNSIWEISWAYLTSPAIIQYFAKYDLTSQAARSPIFRNTIIMNSKKQEQYRKTPVKNWEFGRHIGKQPYGSYKGTLIILTNRRVLSAGEAMLGYSKSVQNRIVIGENTGGVGQFSDVQMYRLPYSKIKIKLARQLFLIPDFEECIGFLPDFWLDSKTPQKEVIHWLDDPENYQFKFKDSYEKMLEENNLTPVLPVDVNIIAPSRNVPQAIRAFSGKWFGITEGVLDQIIVVESINDKMEVRAIYSWSVAYPWGINQPGWERYKGKFQNQKLLLRNENNTINITCSLNSDGTLHAIYNRPGVLAHITMTRCDD
jgi:hypothetical protein